MNFALTSFPESVQEDGATTRSGNASLSLTGTDSVGASDCTPSSKRSSQRARPPPPAAGPLAEFAKNCKMLSHSNFEKCIFAEIKAKNASSKRNNACSLIPHGHSICCLTDCTASSERTWQRLSASLNPRSIPAFRLPYQHALLIHHAISMQIWNKSQRGTQIASFALRTILQFPEWFNQLKWSMLLNTIKKKLV